MTWFLAYTSPVSSKF